ncbi:Maturation and nuclear export of 40S ribosomal subunits interacting protein [Naganishia albida]|nr:Maturation and nuclear export of 40S ribosomal subunits interacting protein [Naganishia albida]
MVASSLPSKAYRQAATANSTASQIAKITEYETQLTSAVKKTEFNPNALIPLTALARHESPEVVHKAVWALYRAWVKILSDGHLVPTPAGGQGDAARSKNGSEDESPEAAAAAVQKWMMDRLNEYLEILAGLLRDSEPSLRKSAATLSFSVLPPISVSLSNQVGKQIISMPHISRLLQTLIHETQSLRGAKPSKKASTSSDPTKGRWQVVEDHQYHYKGEVETELLPTDVADEVARKLADYDDLRWAFFRELSTYLQSLSETGEISSVEPYVTANILSLLLPLNNLPKQSEDINTFYFEHLSTSPLGKSKKAKSAVSKRNPARTGSGQDWMAYYDSSDEEDSDDDEDKIVIDAKTGKKRKRGKVAGLDKKVKKSILGQVWSVESHVRLFTDCWLGVLNLPLSLSETRSILLVLHSTIFPNMVKGRVVRMTDWLSTLCDRGGPLALLSLNGLYVLMTSYNLEYPHFYRQLYNLMDREVMHVKYRARFFRLSETFLSSTHLPAAMIASFVKRLARLALSAPPAAIIMIIPFVYNLLKRHSSCMCMLQRDAEDAESQDTYDEYEKDPMNTHALESSLWELKTLQRHYLSHVATMSKVFQEVFTKPEFQMEDFLDHGYATLFETEIKRRLKNPPALAVEVEDVQQAFPAADAAGEDKEDQEEDVGVSTGDVIQEHWTFGPAL